MVRTQLYWTTLVMTALVVCGFTGVAEAARGDGLTNLLGETGTGLLIIAAGIFSIAGGLFAWPFFMNHRKAQFFVRILGMNGARGLYVVLGALICFCGVMVLTGNSKPKNADAAPTITHSR